MKYFIILALLFTCVFAAKKLQASTSVSVSEAEATSSESAEALSTSEGAEVAEASESAEGAESSEGAESTEEVATESSPPLIATGPSIVTVVTQSKMHTILSSLLQNNSDVSDMLMQTGPYTLFAPTDAAFSRVPADKLAALQADTESLMYVLQYHVLSGMYRTNDLEACQMLPTEYNSEMVLVRRDSAGVSLNDMARVVDKMANKKAPNGIVHAIDYVLMPMSMWDCSSMSGTQCLLSNGCRLRMNGKCRNTKHVCSRREYLKSVSKSLEASMEASEKASKSMSKSLSKSAAANPTQSVSAMTIESAESSESAEFSESAETSAEASESAEAAEASTSVSA
jgi:uncharacterized surface protein with fasciclin (FAS1) repeats